MKTKVIVIIAAAAMLATGCRDIRRQVNDLLTYPTTAEEVAAAAKDYHSDAALVVTKADTQYVLYRRSSAYSNRDGIQRCYAMRYVSQHRCRHDFSGRGGEFRLYEPEQPVALTRNSDKTLALAVDSVLIAVDDIAVTDSATTFRFGFDEPDRSAVLYFYGDAAKAVDPFSETTIQQMLSLALMLDDLMADWDTEIDTGFVAAESALEEAEVEIEEAGDALKVCDYYAEYSRIDSIAYALGFTEKETVAHGDSHLKYVASGGKGGAKACRERMEGMKKAAADCHCRQYKIAHNGFTHRKCSFTIEW